MRCARALRVSAGRGSLGGLGAPADPGPPHSGPARREGRPASPLTVGTCATRRLRGLAGAAGAVAPLARSGRALQRHFVFPARAKTPAHLNLGGGSGRLLGALRLRRLPGLGLHTAVPTAEFRKRRLLVAEYHILIVTNPSLSAFRSVPASPVMFVCSDAICTGTRHVWPL